MLKKLGILLLGAGCAWAAQAKVDEVQAARLDQDLTPLGAERAGNADGSIPPWTGGITQAPAGYRPGMHHLDPFAADRPRLVVDSRNMAAYQALLTPGTQALLQARGERRVRRLPTLAYDSLQPDTNGMATADTVDVYNGAPDHYEWALLGKREMLVPYNSYAVHQKGLAYGDILKSRFINPDLLRYELHRVWVVEATLRKGFSHPYAKRRFYLDEDSWQILAADIYDKDGVLTRAQEVHPINYYDVPLVSSTLEAIYDFKGGRYFVDGLDNNEPMYDFGVQVGPRDFTPQALRREGN